MATSEVVCLKVKPAPADEVVVPESGVTAANIKSPAWVVVRELVVTDVVLVPALLVAVPSRGDAVATPLYSAIAILRQSWDTPPKETVTVLAPAVILAA